MSETLTPATPLVLLDFSPLPSPAPARLLPALLQLLADGGSATECYYRDRPGYWLRIRDVHGRGVWANAGWVYAWEQARRWKLTERSGWCGNAATYGLSAAGREWLENL